MPEAVTMTEAARRLGISRVTVRRLVREGKLPVTDNPLDRRQKLIPVDAVLQFAVPTPRPESIGMIDDLGVTSDEVDSWLEANWQPC
jgi:excisionase family DNA binding protein